MHFLVNFNKLFWTSRALLFNIITKNWLKIITEKESKLLPCVEWDVKSFTLLDFYIFQVLRSSQDFYRARFVRSSSQRDKKKCVKMCLDSFELTKKYQI